MYYRYSCWSLVLCAGLVNNKKISLFNENEVYSCWRLIFSASRSWLHPHLEKSHQVWSCENSFCNGGHIIPRTPAGRTPQYFIFALIYGPIVFERNCLITRWCKKKQQQKQQQKTQRKTVNIASGFCWLILVSWDRITEK